MQADAAFVQSLYILNHDNTIDYTYLQWKPIYT